MNSFLCLAVIALGLFATQFLRTEGIAVMSVDLGNEFSKIGIVKPGVPMEIVLNKESQRKTASVVFIGDDERLFAEAANMKGIRKPHQRYANLLDLLGKNMSHPAVIKYKEAYRFYDMVEDPVTGNVVFRVKSGEEGDTKTFRPEELVAMILEYARKNVEDFSHQTVKSGIITVPVHFGQLERQALLRAAELAGIDILQLLNDNAATALQFSLVKLATISETPQYYIIFDMGSSHATATVLSLEKAKSKDDGELVEHVVIRGVAVSRDLTTTAVHNAIRSHLIKQFEANSKSKNVPDLHKDPRAMAKLFKEAARLVHILSANNAVSSNIEGLVGDVDFSGHVLRADLEEACGPIFKQVPELVKEALKRANIGAEAITEIVLMGAGTRIPKVQELLRKSLEGREEAELSKGLNTDEAASIGAVYHAAHLSKGFKVKRIVLRDAVIYPISVEFDRILEANSTKKEEGIVKRMLFDMSSPFPQKKLITFGKHSNDFTFNVSFSGNIDPVWMVKVHGVGAAFEKHADKVSKGVKAHFAMDESGLLQLRMMEAVFEAEENETVTTESPSSGGIFSSFGDKLKGLFNSGEVTNSSENATNSTEPGTEGTDTPTPQSEGNGSDSTAANATSEGATVKTKTVIYRENLTFTIELLDSKPFPEEELAKSHALMTEFRKKDETRLKLAKAKNDLEAAVIDVKIKLEDTDAKKAISEKEWDTVFAKAKEIGDWLDEEAGPMTPLSEYTEKQSDLRKTILPWYERMRQAYERPRAIGMILQTLNHSDILLKTFRVLSANITAETSDVLFSEAELNGLERQINETMSWLSMMLEAQNATPAHEDPKLKIEEIREKGAILEREARYLTNKAKAYRPKPKTTPKPRKAKKNENDSIVIEDNNTTTPVEPTGAETGDIPPTTENESAESNEEPSPAPEAETEKKTEGEKKPEGTEGEDANPTHSPEL